MKFCNGFFDIKQFVFPILESNMYIISENGRAIVIDPHISEDAYIYLEHCGIQDVSVILTHEHFDHTCGIIWFREHYKTTVICQRNALKPKVQKIWNNPMILSVIQMNEEANDERIKELIQLYPLYEYEAEIAFDEKLEMEWNGHVLRMVHIPGHSEASCLIMVDEDIVFTGDSLIPDEPITLRWPGSSPKDYYEWSLGKLLSIAPDKLILPGHGQPKRMSELKYESGIFKTL